MRSATVVSALAVALGAVCSAAAVSCGHSPGTTFGVVTDGGEAGADGSAASTDAGGDAAAVGDGGGPAAVLCCAWPSSNGTCTTNVLTLCDTAIGYQFAATCLPDGTCVEAQGHLAGTVAPCPVCSPGFQKGGCGGAGIGNTTDTVITVPMTCALQGPEYQIGCVCPGQTECASTADGGLVCL